MRAAGVCLDVEISEGWEKSEGEEFC